MIDGFETTRRIRDERTDVRWHGIPVIAMTANALPGDRERCLGAGMNDYLSKPLKRQELKVMLEKWTDILKRYLLWPIRNSSHGN